jgi:hypothetical protein
MRAGDDDCSSYIGRKRFDVNVFLRSMSSNKKQNSTRRERDRECVCRTENCGNSTAPQTTHYPPPPSNEKRRTEWSGTAFKSSMQTTYGNAIVSPD